MPEEGESKQDETKMDTEDPGKEDSSSTESLDFSTPITGRVVRLQFQCHAELPIGSYLRVTGSSLWAPGTTPSDPMNAHHIAQERQTDAFPTPGEETIEGGDQLYWYNHPTNLYASSIEMVTSPETYPIWTTKQPVIVVLNPTSSAIQHHYYRYLVVNPGAANDDAAVAGDGSNLDAATNPTAMEGGMRGDTLEGATSTSPQDGANATSSPVMMWEHPFSESNDENNPQQQQNMSQLQSTQSFATQSTMAAGGGAAKDQFSSTLAQLAQLPYRTLDINVETAHVASPLPEDRLDTWNNGEDKTFQAYQIRDSMTRSQSNGEVPNNNNNSVGASRNNRHHRINSNASTLSGVSLDGREEAQDTPMMVTAPANTAATSMSSTGDSSQMEEDLPSPPYPVKTKSSSKILFICFHLPVVVVKVNGEWQATWSESLLARTEGSRIVGAYRAHWIGTVTPHPPISSESDRDAVRKILAEMDCTPIFINRETRQAHYYGFCKQVLWPAFHNIDLLDLSTSGVVKGGANSPLLPVQDGEYGSDWDQSRLDHWWDAYRRVNQEFATVVNSLVDRDSSSYLWIHDYHLSLLPQYLNEEPAKSCRKVFFLHIPFPTSQIFRELECGEQILRGMLHADVVGFHAFDHARHFLNAGKRILGLNYESLVGGLIGVQFMGRTVLVSMSNVSIEPRMADGKLDRERQTHTERGRCVLFFLLFYFVSHLTNKDVAFVSIALFQ